MASRRFNSCAVVGSSPELLMYKDGRAIDAHDAVFRANLAVVDGYAEHVGERTTVRVINPVESVVKARNKCGADFKKTLIIKNQDPPAIRSPSNEHSDLLSGPNQSGPCMRNAARRHKLACAASSARTTAKATPCARVLQANSYMKRKRQRCQTF